MNERYSAAMADNNSSAAGRKVLGRITSSEGKAPASIPVRSEQLREHARRVDAVFRPTKADKIR
jgi:hypothetical protein